MCACVCVYLTQVRNITFWCLLPCGKGTINTLVSMSKNLLCLDYNKLKKQLCLNILKTLQTLWCQNLQMHFFLNYRTPLHNPKNCIVNHSQVTNHFVNAIHCIRKCFITTHIFLITLFHHVPAPVCYVLM